MKQLLHAFLLAALSTAGRAQTITLLDLSGVATTAVLNGQVGNPVLAVGQSLTLTRPYSDGTALSPVGSPVFYGGYSISYTNNTSGVLQTNTVETVVGTSDPSPKKALRIGAYNIFDGNAGTLTTEIEGLIYVPVFGVSTDVVPFARFLPTSFSGVPTNVSGELRVAARIGSDWFVSDSAMLSYTFLSSTTTISSGLTNFWRPFDPVSFSYGAAELLPAGTLTGVGAYFDHVGTTAGSGNFVSEVYLDRIGYITAVPEASTYWLAAPACLLLIAGSRRKFFR